MGEKYKSLIERITYGLVKDNSIDAADVEAYKFGLEVTILKIFHYASYIVIALCMKKFFELVIIFAVFYVFRCNTGGFHAKTRIGCYLFSCAVIFISLIATDLSFGWWSLTIVSILNLILLSILSPVQSTNRKLDTEDIVHFRRRLKKISIIFLIIYVLTARSGEIYFIKLYTIGLTAVTLLTILGILQVIRQN